MPRFIKTHGKSFTPEYRAWASMRSRCRNPKHAMYPDYGGRGIRVSERWDSFENFYADMGARPPSGTLDRINNDGNYEPKNCRWASMLVQDNNKRNNRPVEWKGERKTIPEWARQFGKSPRQVRKRFAAGWTLEEALTRESSQGQRQSTWRNDGVSEACRLNHPGEPAEIRQTRCLACGRKYDAKRRARKKAAA